MGPGTFVYQSQNLPLASRLGEAFVLDYIQGIFNFSPVSPMWPEHPLDVIQDSFVGAR